MSDDRKPNRTGWKAVLAVIVAVQLAGVGLYMVVERERASLPTEPIAFEHVDVALDELDLERPGQRVGAAELAEGNVLLHVWATWCRPCRRELPVFLNLDGAVAGRLIAASVDEEWPVIDHYFSGSVPSHVWRVPSGTRRLPVDTLPTTLVVRDGTVVARMAGAREWSPAGVMNLLSAIGVD